MVSRRLLTVPFIAAAAVGIFFAHGAAAQPATGTITGRVLWGTCIRAIPLPAAPQAPDAQAQPAIPQPAPTTSGLPAGAVLVAVQNTAISARTDETGGFSLSGVPAGQYLTVAAGPVANASSAVAERPNVLVSGGQSVDLGTLTLGGAQAPNIGCRLVTPALGVSGAAPATDVTPDATDTTP